MSLLRNRLGARNDWSAQPFATLRVGCEGLATTGTAVLIAAATHLAACHSGRLTSDPLVAAFASLPACAEDPASTICLDRPAWDAVALRDRLAARNHAVWAEPDRLVFVCRSTASKVLLGGGIQAMMSHVESTDLWAVAVRFPRIGEAALSYLFLPVDNGSVGFRPIAEGVFRGPDARPATPRAAVLAGSVVEEELRSAYLDEARRVSVYVPPGSERERPLPVVYLADGRMVEELAGLVEPLIEDGSLPPVLLVGIHAAAGGGEPGGVDRRGEEYLRVVRSPRFEAHMRFVSEEVLPWSRRVFGASADPSRVAIFGASNGGACALSFALAFPGLVRNVIAFSVAGGGPEGAVPRGARCYLVAGTLEPAALRITSAWAAHLRAAECDLSFRTRLAGHDPLLWHEELPAALLWLFGSKERGASDLGAGPDLHGARPSAHELQPGDLAPENQRPH